MTTETLILTPDPIKKRLLRFGIPLTVLFGLYALLFAIYKDFRPGFMFYLAIAAFIYWSIFRVLRASPQDSRLELKRDGIMLTLAGNKSFHKWTHLSRITLLEQISRDEHDKISVESHFLAARLSNTGSEEADRPTHENDADILLPIDLYISYHRYSGRTEKQEEACKSAPDLANTVNAWRDYALNLEIGAVPTPVVQTENKALSNLSQELNARLTS